LRAIGTSEDGLVEAVELPGHAWLLGVQWHPEMMYAAHDEHLRLFQALVAASLARATVPA
jgi:gamma-glutamyl-gamma-aminobutyrate hydrolase PuuD